MGDYVSNTMKCRDCGYLSMGTLGEHVNELGVPCLCTETVEPFRGEKYVDEIVKVKADRLNRAKKVAQGWAYVHPYKVRCTHCGREYHTRMHGMIRRHVAKCQAVRAEAAEVAAVVARVEEFECPALENFGTTNLFLDDEPIGYITRSVREGVVRWMGWTVDGRALSTKKTVVTRKAAVELVVREHLIRKS